LEWRWQSQPGIDEFYAGADSAGRKRTCFSFTLAEFPESEGIFMKSMLTFLKSEGAQAYLTHICS